jgi:VanZ like family
VGASIVEEDKVEPESLSPRLRGLIIAAAWASLAVVAYATLSRAGLVYRLYFMFSPFLGHPSMRAYASAEHLFAYMIVGMLFSAIYPRSTLRICLFLFIAIACLEAMQSLTPDRHGTFRDAIEKMVGGATGVFLTRFGLQWIRTWRTPVAR